MRGWQRLLLALIGTGAAATFFLVAILVNAVFARDLGQWENSDPKVREFYENLKQPNSNASCCGPADSYYCDEVHVRQGKTYCTITDDRPDGPLKRPHIDVGTEIFIPDDRLTWKDGNPTGHTLVFLSTYGFVYCFVQTGGT